MFALPNLLSFSRMAAIPPLAALLAAGWHWLAAALLRTVNMQAAKSIGTALGARLQRLNWLGLGIAGLLLMAVGLISLANGAPVSVSWLAAKILVYGLVYWFAVGIDWMFLPLGRLTAELAEQGSSEQIEADITRTVDRTMRAVLAVYASTLAAAYICMTRLEF